jgi:hypothetical protein
MGPSAKADFKTGALGVVGRAVDAQSTGSGRQGRSRNEGRGLPSREAATEAATGDPKTQPLNRSCSTFKRTRSTRGRIGHTRVNDLTHGPGRARGGEGTVLSRLAC